MRLLIRDAVIHRVPLSGRASARGSGALSKPVREAGAVMMPSNVLKALATISFVGVRGVGIDYYFARSLQHRLGDIGYDM